MERKTIFFTLFVNLWLLASTIAAPNPQRLQNSLPQEAEITKFHVDTQIQLRYAITDVETQIRNRHIENKEIFFHMFIPLEAFVSNFSMVIKGKSYEAKVKTKELADQTYKESKSTSGLVKSKALTNGKKVSDLYMICFRSFSTFRYRRRVSIIRVL